MIIDEKNLHQEIQAFIRQFGLLHPSETPCGQPLPVSQAHALLVLGQGGELTQQALAGELRLDKSTTSRLVAQLAERGWVDKAVNPEDRREARISLTPRGRELFAEVSASAAARYRALWERLPPQKRSQVVEALALLTEALQEI